MRNSTPRTSIEQVIVAMTRRIVAQFDPERVILFGSHARGDADPDSDVDLLVVMPFHGARSSTQAAIRLALRDFKVAKDIVVSTPDEFAWRSQIPGTIERPAALEGKVLHARQ